MQSDDEQGDIDVTSDEDGSLSYRNGVGNGLEDDDDLNQDGQDELDKRAHHNALERKRRDHIKESFSSLRDSLPNIKGEKSSRAQILKQATEYIEGANLKNKKRSTDISQLKEENRRLLMEVNALEKSAGLTSFTTRGGKGSGGGASGGRPDGSSSESDMEEVTSRHTNSSKSRPRKKLKV